MTVLLIATTTITTTIVLLLRLIITVTTIIAMSANITAIRMIGLVIATVIVALDMQVSREFVFEDLREALL